jgi:hypothetical protein
LKRFSTIASIPKAIFVEQETQTENPFVVEYDINMDNVSNPKLPIPNLKPSNEKTKKELLKYDKLSPKKWEDEEDFSNLESYAPNVVEKSI